MICLLNQTKVTTNEEYKKVIKTRIKIFTVMMILGVVTAALVNIKVMSDIITLPEFMKGVYTGLGSGLFFISIIMIIKNSKLLKDETALKKSRLSNQDERNILISQQSTKCAALVVILCSYIGMLIVGIFNVVIFYCFWFVVMLFVIAYLFFTFYFNKKL